VIALVTVVDGVLSPGDNTIEDSRIRSDETVTVEKGKVGKQF